MSISMRTRIGLLTLGAASLVALTGCTLPLAPLPSASPTETPSASETAEAEPTPTPLSRPALADLELSPDGLGPLLLGEPPVSDPALRMVAFEPEGCTDAETGESFGIVAGDPEAGGWFIDPSYRLPATPSFGGNPFGVGVDESEGNAVTRIDLYSADIPTDEGIRIGDSRADVEAAYPGASVAESYLTDIFVISGPSGLLQIEVVSQSTDDKAEYWGSTGIPDGEVVYIHAVVPAFGVFSVAASGNGVGGCNFS
ncbi:hypothetical protein [Microcella indica]|uniref:hypothetical protein n=1 Tax=Microcella indica TaxID=2750620 RepID=UPI0015CF0AB2|nr:hypothetical protein [Microcella indica]